MPPTHSSVRETTIEALRLASLAPSAHNTQPWECQFVDGEVHVKRSIARTLQAGDPTTRQAWLGVGMFLESFAIAAVKLGLNVEVETLYGTPRDTALVRLRAAHRQETEVGEETERLFSAIHRRHTNRGRYRADTPLPWLESWTVSQEAVTVFAVQDNERKRQLASVAGASIRLALSLPALRRELAELIQPDSAASTVGMPVAALVGHNAAAGGQSLAAALEPEQQASAFAVRYQDAPAIIVISTDTDDPQAWIRAGREGMRVLLYAASEGLTHCISAGPVEVPTLSPVVRAATTKDLRPQLFFRVGEPLEAGYSSERTRRLDPSAWLSVS